MGARIPGSSEKTCAIQSQDGATINPSQAVTRKLCEKLCSRRNHRDETETSATHSETKREIITQNASGAELRKRTRCHRCRQLGHLRESVRIQHRRTLPNLQPRISFCQEMLVHNCTICHLTCCLMVRPRLLWDATSIRSTLSLLV